MPKGASKVKSSPVVGEGERASRVAQEREDYCGPGQTQQDHKTYPLRDCFGQPNWAARAPAITVVDVTAQMPPSFVASASSLLRDFSHETFDFNFNSHGPSFDFNFEFQALAASSSAGVATPFDALDDFSIVSETASGVENFPDTWGPIDLSQLVAVDTSTPMVPAHEAPTLTGWEPTTLDELVASPLFAAPGTHAAPAHGFSQGSDGDVPDQLPTLLAVVATVRPSTRDSAEAA
ncbi:hypothetical protein FB451DRAFT_1360022 [Mycena latifolia]|nr:hypothetical protein FB451DRAFT_1360022 [Mycena latifolia]